MSNLQYREEQVVNRRDCADVEGKFFAHGVDFEDNLRNGALAVSTALIYYFLAYVFGQHHFFVLFAYEHISQNNGENVQKSLDIL